MTTYDWLCAMLIKEYKLAPESITSDGRLEDLGVDSLGIAELLFNVEDAFGITLPPNPVQLPTLGDVVRYIDDLVLTQNGHAPVAVPGP
jgi:acyl carrier protein